MSYILPKIINIKETEIKNTTIMFIKHPGKMFSWDLWNKFTVKCFSKYSVFFNKIS